MGLMDWIEGTRPSYLALLVALVLGLLALLSFGVDRPERGGCLLILGLLAVIVALLMANM